MLGQASIFFKETENCSFLQLCAKQLGNFTWQMPHVHAIVRFTRDQYAAISRSLADLKSSGRLLELKEATTAHFDSLSLLRLSTFIYNSTHSTEQIHMFLQCNRARAERKPSATPGQSRASFLSNINSTRWSCFTQVWHSSPVRSLNVREDLTLVVDLKKIGLFDYSCPSMSPARGRSRFMLGRQWLIQFSTFFAMVYAVPAFSSIPSPGKL